MGEDHGWGDAGQAKEFIRAAIERARQARP